MVKASLEIIAENDHFIVINKPPGLLSIPDREGKEISLKEILQQKYDQIFTVHRLDRETSGIIVFAKDPETHKFLSQAFEERTVEKYYQGIVVGTLPEKQKTIDAPIAENTVKRGVMIIHQRGKHAVTDYEVLEDFGKFSLVQFRIHTGRTHQIRVHMQYVGHPLVCDEVYGDGIPVKISSFKRNYKLSKNEEEEKPILSRIGLHAQRLRFTDMEGNAYDLTAEMPKDMRALLQQLRKNA
ncbi:RNA pseudouridine synthase [Niastella yeongjuensis]|uniref:Pseudouridine synthase n=1 Tax=Niastella yeongjuensis TaxID=354355 RepID=A0A1V9EY42_9BACT|nr:RNA pseudouridine synthase [Niastella yeongjuensis]OQP51060.1 RNA pseudouridine synthase [Niastella yeongjuensis]SEN04557.1 23S rRNA pseudouridine955/2504/2580 synthase [Niastella yeongjuensis]